MHKPMRNRGLLLDRDGVVNVDHGYVGTREKFTFRLGLFPFLREAQDRGYRLAIVTNQSGVGRGYYSRQDYEVLTDWMLGALRREGIAVELVLASFTHPEATLPEFRRASFWRKPNPGMILEAMLRLRLDPARSAMLGDKQGDMIAAQAAGVGNCLLLTDDKTMNVPGATRVADLSEALAALG